MNKQKGVTLIVLVVTTVVLLIISGVTIATLTDDRGIIDEANETTSAAERKSIIQKLEAELYTEKAKTGKKQTANDLINIIKENDYGTVTVKENPNENVLFSTNGYEIKFSEILGWEN